jgi:hypothetical protein
MEHLSSDMEQQQHQEHSKNSYNGEETKCRSFAAKDTAKERYHKYCVLTNPLFAGNDHI